MADDSYFGTIEYKEKGSFELHIFREGWCADYPNPDEWLDMIFNTKTGLFKWLLRGNKALEQEFTDLIDQAQREFDITKSKKLYRRAEEILTKEAVVVVPLYFENTLFLVKPWLKNWYNMAFGSQRIRDWSLSLSEN